MPFVIIHEHPPIAGVRQFKAHPTVYHNEAMAGDAADKTAKRERAKAWACEIPLPPVLEIASVTDIADFGRGRK